MKRYWKVGLYVFLLVFMLALVFTTATTANPVEFTADSGVYNLIGQSTNQHSNAFYLWEHDGYVYVAISTSLLDHQIYSLSIESEIADLYYSDSLSVKDALDEYILEDIDPPKKSGSNYRWLIGKVDIEITEEIVINLSAPGGFALVNFIYEVRGALNVFHEYPLPIGSFQDFDQSEASNTIGGLAAGVYPVEPEDPPKLGYQYASVTVEIDGTELLSVNAGATGNEIFADGSVNINQFGIVTVTLTSTSSKIIDIIYLYGVQTYTITYNANTGTGTLVDPDSPYNFNATVTVLDPEDDGNISKTGYNFVGWNTKADGTGTSYKPGETFNMPAQNVTLYAIWEIDRYTVTYNANTGTGTLVDPDSPYNFNATVTVLDPEVDGDITKAGSTFTRWNTKADGTGTSYNPGETFNMPAQNVTLYAIWDTDNYTVTYSSNTGNGMLVDPASPYNFNDTVTVLNPEVDGNITKTGSTFIRWNTKADGTGTSYNPGETFNMPAQNVTLYAQWEAIDYTLRINYYYGSVGGTVAELPYIDNTLNVGDAYSVSSPVISGYTASQTTVTGIMPANDVTVNVIYTAIDYRDPFIPSPSITVKKHISVDGGTNWLDAETAPGPSVVEGSALRFRFVVTNTGNVSLTGLTLTDSDFNLGTIQIPALLAPGQSFEHTLTGITATLGQHQNTARASGVYAGTVYSDFDRAHYWGYSIDKPGLSVKKYVSTDGGTTWNSAPSAPGPSALVGDKVQFKFVVTNTGNVALTSLTLTDSDFDLSGATLPASLNPGKVYEYILTGIDVVEGQHVNTATVTGKHGTQTYTATDKAHYKGVKPAVVVPEISIKKYVSVNKGVTWLDAQSGPGPAVAVGEEVRYKFVVTNTGNVTLTGIKLEDNVYSLTGAKPPLSLEPGKSYEFILSGVKAEAGLRSNIATATGRYEGQTVVDTDLAHYTGSATVKPTPPTGGQLSAYGIIGLALLSAGLLIGRRRGLKLI